jgi:hypothetical protein
MDVDFEKVWIHVRGHGVERIRGRLGCRIEAVRLDPDGPPDAADGRSYGEDEDCGTRKGSEQAGHDVCRRAHCECGFGDSTVVHGGTRVRWVLGETVGDSRAGCRLRDGLYETTRFEDTGDASDAGIACEPRGRGRGW